MTTLAHIESLTAQYAAARGELSDLLTRHRAEVDAVTHRLLPAIRHAVARANDLGARLKADVQAAPALFDKPRTRTFSGVRVGYMKQRGKVEIDDEAKTIGLIRKLLPAEQAELLISTKESVHKPSVADLTATDLKRLGIRVTEDTDEVVIKPTDSNVDKLVAALLKDTETLEADAA